MGLCWSNFWKDCEELKVQLAGMDYTWPALHGRPPPQLAFYQSAAHTARQAVKAICTLPAGHRVTSAALFSLTAVVVFYLVGYLVTLCLNPRHCPSLLVYLLPRAASGTARVPCTHPRHRAEK